MAHKMKIRKGDTVHMLSGKDRGKQGRVIESRPISRSKRWRLVEILERAR